MLIQQNDMQTNAAPAAGVNIDDRLVSNGRINGPCHSGIRLGMDGVLSTINAGGGFSAQSGEWLLSGSAAAFFVQRTIISGTLHIKDPPDQFTDPGPGFLQLNVDRVYDNQKASAGLKITEVFFEISSDASGVPIVDTATMTFESEVGEL